MLQVALKTATFLLHVCPFWWAAGKAASYLIRARRQSLASYLAIYTLSIAAAIACICGAFSLAAWQPMLQYERKSSEHEIRMLRITSCTTIRTVAPVFYLTF